MCDPSSSPVSGGVPFFPQSSSSVEEDNQLIQLFEAACCDAIHRDTLPENFAEISARIINLQNSPRCSKEHLEKIAAICTKVNLCPEKQISLTISDIYNRCLTAKPAEPASKAKTMTPEEREALLAKREKSMQEFRRMEQEIAKQEQALAFAFYDLMMAIDQKFTNGYRPKNEEQ